MRQCLSRLTAFALDFAHFEIGGSYWVRRPVLVGLAVGIHDAEIVFCVLIQIFGRYPVTARRRFAGERDITFEDLVSVAPDFYVRTVAVESLDPMRHPWTAMVRVITVVATARAFVWSWSHDTCLIAVDIIGLCPAGKVPLALSDGLKQICRLQLHRAPESRHPRRDGRVFQPFFAFNR
jgi:hypothetical protein